MRAGEVVERNREKETNVWWQSFETGRKRRREEGGGWGQKDIELENEKKIEEGRLFNF